LYILVGIYKVEDGALKAYYGEVICISEFGSYRTEYRNKGRSHIDLGVV